MSASDSLNALREAIRMSPDNAPLRKLYAQTLASNGYAEEAEKEFKQALTQWPDDIDLKLGLASAFQQQGKSSAALVIVEDLIRLSPPPARAFLLHCRLLLRAGEIEKAVRQYKRAMEADDSLADPELAARLGVRASEGSSEEFQEQEVVEGKQRIAAGESGGASSADIERPVVRFKDVGGMDALKDEIRMKIIHPMEHPDLYKAYGKPIGGGILLYGPPGCGKTHLARATAGEINASFLSIGLNDVLDMWIGSSERNLHAFFEQGRRNRPCVLFFDEVDAIAASRSDMRHSGGRQIINQFLSELDGIQSSNDGLLILAATNAPWHLDSAFRRPGRFDRILFVPPPDAPARASILQVLLRGKPVENIDHDHIAKKTDAFSGADLKSVVDQAIEAKLRDAMRDGIPRPLTTKDLLAASAGLRPTTREWFSTARNYALYANQGGTYDDVLNYMRIQKIS